MKTGEPRTQPDEFWFDVAQKLMMTELQVGRGVALRHAAAGGGRVSAGL